MLPRLLEDRLQLLLTLFPVVFLAGPRQAGKTTLALKLAGELGLAYRTLDDPTELAAARTDPRGYVGALPVPTVLDEVQRAPEIFLPLKLRVDRERRPGAFLLTGSANVLLLPQVADALPGRMAVARLLPLSQAELEGERELPRPAPPSGQRGAPPPPPPLATCGPGSCGVGFRGRPWGRSPGNGSGPTWTPS